MSLVKNVNFNNISQQIHLQSPPEVTVTSIFKRVINSQVCQLIGLTTVFTAFRAAIIHSRKKIPLIVTITCLATIALKLYRHRERLIYELTLAYPVIRSKLDPNWQWFHQIVPKTGNRGAVYLGTIPLKNLGHHESLKHCAFLSMIRDFEFSSTTPWSDPVTPADWDKLKAPHKQIPAKDFNPVPHSMLLEAIKWIDKQTSKGKDVYVHCKAGRSRSGSAVICYLLYQKMKMGTLSNNSHAETLQSYQKVKSIRPRIIISQTNLKNIEQFQRILINTR